jgi:hypothetical protein
MKSSHSQKGNAVTIVIIVVLVMAVLGLLGYVFWNNFMNKPATKTAETNQTQATKTTSESKTLAITEWGVSGNYSTDSGIQYGWFAGQAGGSTLYLEVPSYSKVCVGNYGGSIQRLLGSDHVSTPTGETDQTYDEYYAANPNEYGKKIDDYYYSYTNATAPCGNDKNLESQLKSAGNEIVSSLKAN